MFFRLIIAFVIVYLVYHVGKTFFFPSGTGRGRFPKRPTPIKGEDLVKDPYCGTYVPVNDAHKINVEGETLYFCSDECMKKYKAEKMT